MDGQLRQSVLGCPFPHLVCYFGPLSGALERASLLLPVYGPAPAPEAEMRRFASAAAKMSEVSLRLGGAIESGRAELFACEARAWATLLAGESLDEALRVEGARWIAHCRHIQYLATATPEPRSVRHLTWNKRMGYWQDPTEFESIAERIRYWHSGAYREPIQKTS